MYNMDTTESGKGPDCLVSLDLLCDPRGTFMIDMYDILTVIIYPSNKDISESKW